MSTSVSQPPQNATSLPKPVAAGIYATFFARLFAILIDGILVGLPLHALRIGDGERAALFGPYDVVAHRTYTVAQLVLFILYETLLIGLWNGQTIGKKILGIRVVHGDGEAVSLGRALVRSLTKILSEAVFLLGYLWMLWDPKCQTWHDKLADTYVVRM